MNILIADDHPINLKLLRVMLEDEGHCVFEAADGIVALDLLTREPVDAIISDILMPRMDGYRLCHEIRHHERWRHLPFVFYTATYVSAADQKVALDVGADEFVRKPSPIGVIRAALETARGRQRDPLSANPPNEAMIMREYSERLVAKLEEKNRELIQANEQLHAFAARLETVREQERTRIAREIHDVLAQELTRLKIDLVWIAKRLAAPVNEDTRPGLVERITDATTQTDTAITTVQRIATELRPVILDSLGLPAAVEWQAEDFARRTGIACEARAPGGETTLGRDRATALFRILQESLTNVARHAQATTVEINLTEEAGLAVLSVSDNGRGIAPAQLTDRHSIGLMGMRERAEAFGGRLTIAGRPGAGTTITVRMPVDEAPA